MRALPILDDAHYIDYAPINLVTILDVSGRVSLDVSGRVSGSKLNFLKLAVCLVIEKLGPSNRLTIVYLSESAHKIFLSIE